MPARGLNPGSRVENPVSWPLDDAGKYLEETLGFERREDETAPNCFRSSRNQPLCHVSMELVPTAGFEPA